jgi:hypothetical protein
LCAHQPSLAKREKAAAPEPKAKAGYSARELRLGKPVPIYRSEVSEGGRIAMCDNDASESRIIAQQPPRAASNKDNWMTPSHSFTHK